MLNTDGKLQITRIKKKMIFTSIFNVPVMIYHINSYSITNY